MPPFKLPSIIFALSLIPFTIGAGDTSLVGCNSVGCPTIDGYDRCTVEAVAHIGVGLSRIHNSPSELEGFSLVKESMFQIKPSPAAGVCLNVIEQSCIDKILQNASDVAGEDSRNLCEKLEQEMKKNFDGCTSFGGPGTSLGDFTVKSLDALLTVKNSSDCWPTKQKSDRLLEIAQATSYGNETDTYDEYTEEAYKITPVLTLFVGGNGSIVDHTSSQMTCLKAITIKKHAVEPENPENKAMISRGSWMSLVIVGLAAIIMTL
ncbi:hypothetical protein A7C99_6669 [Trichophyton rubrum]|uniref:Uncharacterized protein n=4 Tax=Trichophyton TaxID=5550 RepID=A0A178EPX4_TRIRU|nr:hypothetical protein A7C99_6669 [Trichophyton rubrum]